jgi:hypothetical protein
MRTYIDFVYSREGELRNSFDDFSQMIQTKLHVIQHIAEQIQNRSLLQSDVNESDIGHIFNEIDYLFTNLREIRKICLQVGFLSVFHQYFCLLSYHRILLERRQQVDVQM